MAATSVGPFALFGGGVSMNMDNVGPVDVFDFITNKHYLTNLTIPRRNLVATSAGNTAFFAGGSLIAQNHYVDTVDIFDFSSGTYPPVHTVSHLSVGRGYFAASSVKIKVFFAGGLDQALNLVDAVDIYDITTKKWSVSYLSSERESLFGLNFLRWAVFGPGYLSKAVDIYDYTINQWNNCTAPSVRVNGVAGSLNSQVIFYGGASPDNFLLTADVLDINTGAWNTIRNLEGAAFASAVTGPNMILIAGGYNATGLRHTAYLVY